MKNFGQIYDIFEIETIRKSLRNLVKYIEKSSQQIYCYYDFLDAVVSEETNNSIYNVNDLKDYKKKVEHYLNNHKDELVIYKLRNNKKITKQDFRKFREYIIYLVNLGINQIIKKSLEIHL